MRAKSALLLVVALGCGVVAAVAISQVVLAQKGGEVQTVGILVVAKDLSAASKLSADAFRLEQWPADRVPVGALSDPKMVENKFTNQRLYMGEPIIDAKLSNKGKEFSVPAGYRIFDIQVRDDSGGVGYIGPGDHVDVFGYFDKGARVNAARSVKVMGNLEVVMIDGVAVVDIEATAPKKTNTMQLLVKDTQYVVLDTASNLANGKLRLALRPREQVASENTLDDGTSFMSWLKESQAQPLVELPIADPIKVPLLLERQKEHDMLVVTAKKTSKYRMLDGQMVEQQPKNTIESEKPPLGGTQSQSYQSPPATKKSSAAVSTPPSVKQPRSIPAVDPTNSVQPVLTWDPTSGAWQTGGFKATYPSEE
jgi:pilus assembly protein CpaB